MLFTSLMIITPKHNSTNKNFHLRPYIDTHTHSHNTVLYIKMPASPNRFYFFFIDNKSPTNLPLNVIRPFNCFFRRSRWKRKKKFFRFRFHFFFFFFAFVFRLLPFPMLYNKYDCQINFSCTTNGWLAGWLAVYCVISFGRARAKIRI